MRGHPAPVLFVVALTACGPAAGDASSDSMVDVTGESGSTDSEQGESESTDTETADTTESSDATDTDTTETETSETGDPELPAIDLDVGGLRTCAVRSDGLVKCWGTGGLGIPAPGVVGFLETPADVDFVDVGFAVESLSAGGSHTCVVSTQGAVRCWGDNTVGQLGYGNSAPGAAVGGAGEPTVVEAGDVDVGGVVVTVDTGHIHTCAILDDQSLRCWGGGSWETEGQLGYGNTEPIGDDELPSSVGPVPVSGPVQQVSLGDTHTCALLMDGSVECWGKNSRGQLGYGHTQNIGDDETPAEVGAVPLPAAAVAIGAGGSHTCALLDTGALICWGSNTNGRLGLGHVETIGDDELPTQTVEVAGPIDEVALGASVTCVRTGPEVRCWGTGTDGMIGQGNEETIGDDETPVDLPAVMTGMSAAGVTAGYRHVCILSTIGEVLCWGKNDQYPTLGYGHEENIGDDEYPATAGPVSLW